MKATKAAASTAAPESTGMEDLFDMLDSAIEHPVRTGEAIPLQLPEQPGIIAPHATPAEQASVTGSIEPEPSELQFGVVPAPGIYRGVPAAMYHSWPAISYSGLKHFEASPEHYLFTVENPGKQTEAMEIGEGFHTALLEPEIFETGYVGMPKVNRSTKEGKAFAAEFKAAHEGKIVLDQDDYEMILRMRDRILSNPRAGGLIESTHTENREICLVWLDSTGVLCKARIDGIANCGTIIDLKSATEGGGHKWRRAFYDLRYHLQDGMYRRGLTHVLQQVFPPDNFPVFDYYQFAFIVAEKGGWSTPGVYELDEDSAALGAQEVGELLARYAECEARNDWPGYSHDESLLLRLPGYAFTDRGLR